MRATTVAVFLVVVCLGGAARAAKSEVEGRKHARKANHLADINKCKAAIPEYDKALRSLKDPSLLFNRGECYRKTGQGDKAIADYKQFLAELPAAPNRAQVEAQIASLEKVAAENPPAPAARPASASAGPVIVPQGPSLRLPPKAAAPPLPSVAEKPAAKPADDDKIEEPELLAEPDLSRPAAAPPPRPSVPPPPALADASQTGLLDQGTSLHAVPADTDQKSGHAWIWVLVGAVVVGGAVGTYLALNQGKTDTSGGALGNYKF